MSDESNSVREKLLFAEIFRQNAENARHVKSERIWFMNIYSIIAAGVLSLLHSIRGEAVLEYLLVLFMLAFSLIGLLTSLRLKAELEECLHQLQKMALEDGSQEFLALGETEGALTLYPKFRWIFPLFYSIATLAFVALLIYRSITGSGSALLK